MRVPSSGLTLEERLIVREGKRLAEQMLAGYAVTANGRFVPENDRLWQRAVFALQDFFGFDRANSGWK